MNTKRILTLATGTAAALMLMAHSSVSFRDARAGSDETAARPNIVVLTTDDQDLASMPVMRNVLAQPHGGWVEFDNAYIVNSICAPSRATQLTGQYSFNHGVIGNNWGDQLDDSNTLPVWLDNAGYRTALVGKYLHSYEETTELVGWDIFRNFEDTVETHTNIAVDFIAESDDEPFFLWLAYHAPHYEADPPPQYENVDAYLPPDGPNHNEPDVSDKSTWLQNIKPIPQATLDEWRAERLNAQRETLALDDSFQTIIDTLEAEGHLDDTLIIFYSDNGYSWGAHRLIKKQCAFEECSHVPLRIRYPGQTANRVESRAVSNVDLAATIADYAGVTPGLPQDGRSLIPLLADPAAPWAEAVLLERPRGNLEYYGVVADGWKYVDYVTQGEVELYDLRADPYELENLSRRPAYAAKRNEMAGRLEALLNGERPPQATPSPTPSPNATVSPSATPSMTETSSPTPSPTATPSPTGTPTATAQATLSPTISPTPGATGFPTPGATASPTATPTATPFIPPIDPTPTPHGFPPAAYIPLILDINR